jgi:LacI family transcriptional regulator
VKAVTIVDVAQRAGVSIKTVSRVINQEPNVREQLRETVRVAIDELGYRPNPAARSLPGSKTYLIALLYKNPVSDYQGKILRGAIERARKSGYQIVPEPVGDEEREDIVLTRMLQHIRVDGLILVPPISDSSRALAVVDRSKIPYVRISPQDDAFRSAFVHMDDERAAFDMTMHLIGLGHRRIGFIGGDPTHAASQQRENGFRRALATSEIAWRSDYVQSGEFTFRSGFEATETLLSLEDRPTAIFGANDETALGALAQAHRQRLDVPDDLSIAGFDDSVYSSVAWPNLTTIRQPVIEMAEEATALLIEGRAGEVGADGHAINKVLPFDLIVRASTAHLQDS